jgi:glycosyltransferase involved in cell wall biosynthesis
MASGLLILASNVNEHPNLLREIYPDLLFDPNDSIELGKKLYNIVNLEKKYKQVLMDRIYERAQTLFNRDMILRRFDEIIRSAVGKKY